MKILVPIKRVVDYNVRIRIAPGGKGVVTDGVRLSINPFDEIAVEEAIRLREQGVATEVVTATIGPAAASQQLRTALAMGADRAIHVETETELEPLDVARSLLVLTERVSPALVLMGKQAIDSDNGQTGPMLAALWGRPQATFASRVEIAGNTVTVAREVDAGIETIEVDLPAVVTTDLRLNEPRFVKLPDILKAKKKPLETLPLADLGIEPVRRMHTLVIEPPPEREPGVRVESARELFELLVERGLL